MNTRTCDRCTREIYEVETSATINVDRPTATFAQLPSNDFDLCWSCVDWLVDELRRTVAGATAV